MTCEVPVLFLAFNRPRQAKRVLERIKSVAPPRLYAHCDGPRPRSANDLKNTEAVRQLIAELGPGPNTELKTLFRTENQGLRKGVYGAINWFFESEEYGIILEDDCVPDPTFFKFCSELLFKYKDDVKIMHIGGTNLSETACRDLSTSYIFSRFPFVWGWASWRRAWQQMEINLDSIDEFERNVGIGRYLPNRLPGMYMMDKFKQTRAGNNNSWAYAWFYSILKNDGFCILPKINLIQNQGIGLPNATNTTKENKNASREARSMPFPLVHPQTIQIHDQLEETIFYGTQKGRWRLILWSILHFIGLR